MNDYFLSKIADSLDEDAVRVEDYELGELLSDKSSDQFKEDYLSFYDDIKLTPKDDW